MLKVPQQQYIKFLYENEDYSISEIARAMGVNWRTAKKYATKDDWNEPVCRRKRRYPVLGPYLDIIDTWLTEEQALPRKQRYTAKRIFDRLRDEYRFEGGRRTVEEYVAKRRKELKLERAESYERLEHPGGEAQVDFGTAYVGQPGQLVERKVLIMSFSFSNAAFAFPVRKENTECFLEAMKHIFERMGGVPRKIWFDNLSAAVVSISRDGKRSCTDQFLRFATHYRFDPEFCNPYRGHEKGHVENKVGYSRRNWLVPPPICETDADLETYLAQAAEADMDRPHYAKKERIVDLWEQERKKLLAMPTVAFEVFRLEPARLNKYRELRFETTTYPLPQCRALDPVLLKVKWDEIEVLSGDGEYRHLGTLPRPYTEKAIPIEWTDVFEGYLRKPRMVMYSDLARFMPASVRRFVQVEDIDLRKSRVALIRRLLDTHQMSDMGAALDTLAGHFDPDTVLEHALYAMKHPEFHPKPFAEAHTPMEIHGHTPDLRQYDAILGVSRA
ncbi:IS21 family transposase [Brevibacillus sp. NSP2.1]|uniref:IS21 family transposase n=1 Tax=Brevibacillus sp. NSP2.1 TaxID=3003229 RepID=UPI001397E5B3|nr:IS21 family transposase [Brevibacillus sp. NSP2.1]QHZ55913.1 IS21 family transposase [Brevibacillus sp. NSP2.1]